jgi:hypothetical protein
MTVYEASSSAILLVDPYNDFLAQGGKLLGGTFMMISSLSRGMSSPVSTGI